MKLKRFAAVMMSVALAGGMIPATALAATVEDSEDFYKCVLMNIPYDEFYNAELSDEYGNRIYNDVTVDAYTSASGSKSQTYSFVRGSYHEDSEEEGIVNQISGVTFPVMFESEDDYNAFIESIDGTDAEKVDDESTADDIVTTNRTGTSVTQLSGASVLFTKPSYSYYEMDDEVDMPFYKVASYDEEGELTFGAAVYEEEYVDTMDLVLSNDENSGDSVFLTESDYGDYEIDIVQEDWAECFNYEYNAIEEETYWTGETDSGREATYYTSAYYEGTTAVLGVIVNTKNEDGEEHRYALRQMENIWSTGSALEISWGTGFVTEVHGGVQLNPDHYKAMMGETINSIVFYTSTGMVTYYVSNDYDENSSDGVYVPIRTANMSVESVDVSAGQTSITLTDENGEEMTFADWSEKYSDFEYEITIDDVTNAALHEDGTITYDTDGLIGGDYKVVIEDTSGKYASLIATLTLTETDEGEDTSTGDGTTSTENVTTSTENVTTPADSSTGQDSATSNVVADQDSGDTAETVSVAKVKKLKKQKVKAKSVTLKWKKVKGASGYEIVRAKKKNGNYKVVKTIKKASKVKFTNKKLSSGKTYYYKVRAYKTVNGEKVYGAYSKVLKVKTK